MGKQGRNFTCTAMAWITRELSGWHGDERIYTVRYEDLVSRTNEELKKVYRFLGITSAEVIDYEKDRNEKWFNVSTSSIWEKEHIKRANSPISENSVEKWAKELSSSEIAVVETITRQISASKRI